MKQEELKVIQPPPPPKCIFELAPNSYVQWVLCCEKPNWFHRLMQRLFFGFVWYDLPKEK